MNWDTVKGDWKQFQGKVKEQWGKLTDDDLNRIEGKRDQLAGAIEKRYGIAKDEAERQVSAFEKQCGECHDDENRTAAESQSRQSREKNMAGSNPMHNPQREKMESGQPRHETHREESKSGANDPKSKHQSGSGQRMQDKDMAGEKPMEGKRPAGAQKQHSQPHGKK